MKRLAAIALICCLGACDKGPAALTPSLNHEIQLRSQVETLGLKSGDGVLVVADASSAAEAEALKAMLGSDCRIEVKTGRKQDWEALLSSTSWKMVFCLGVPEIDAELDPPEDARPLVISVSNFKGIVPDLVRRGWVRTALAPLPFLGEQPRVDRELMIMSQLQSTSAVLTEPVLKGMKERYPELF